MVEGAGEPGRQILIPDDVVPGAFRDDPGVPPDPVHVGLVPAEGVEREDAAARREKTNTTGLVSAVTLNQVPNM